MTPKQRRTFGRALKAARVEAGHTQLAFSRMLNVDPVTVSRWERGESAPNRWLLPALVTELPSLAEHVPTGMLADADAPADHTPSKTGTDEG